MTSRDEKLRTAGASGGFAGEPQMQSSGLAPASPKEGPLELSWEVFGELCRALGVKVARSGCVPDLVIGIAKGGVIPGAVIASILRCDFFSMKISRRVGTEVVSDEPRILSAAPRQAAGKRVLVVDEICSTGQTLRIALNALRQVKPAELWTATNLVKVRGHRPDFYAIETDATVVFPWDRQVVDEHGQLVVNPIYDGLI